MKKDESESESAEVKAKESGADGGAAAGGGDKEKLDPGEISASDEVIKDLKADIKCAT